MVVADTVRRGSSPDGLQPLRLARDWRQVIPLIELAFGEDLDAEARRALRSMRLPPVLASLIALLDGLSLPGEGMMPGFVWLESGRVVGTASVRRVQTFNGGWLISNVAVHPDWQGRGIGRALLEASLDFAQDHGGVWVVLQVRESNLIARRLYESLDFRSIAEVSRLRIPAVGEVTPPVHQQAFRPARWSDGSALSRLARTLTPLDVFWVDGLNRALYKTGQLHRLMARLRGGRRRWWVLDAYDSESGEELIRTQASTRWAGHRFCAAVGVEEDPRLPWHRLRLLVLPEAQDEHLAERLVAFGMAQLANSLALPIEVEHPASDEATLAALTKTGFESVYALIHMRRNLESLGSRQEERQ